MVSGVDEARRAVREQIGYGADLIKVYADWDRPTLTIEEMHVVVEEAHKRGLELHCWFNPYRAGLHIQRGPYSSRHVSRSYPSVVKQYGSFLWMDPGEPFVQQRTLAVIKDVVKRYDIDGIHIDDYFYPYPEGGKDFPDAHQLNGTFASPILAGGKIIMAGGALEQGIKSVFPKYEAYTGRGFVVAREPASGRIAWKSTSDVP